MIRMAKQGPSGDICTFPGFEGLMPNKLPYTSYTGKSIIDSQIHYSPKRSEKPSVKQIICCVITSVQYISVHLKRLWNNASQM